MARKTEYLLLEQCSSQVFLIQISLKCNLAKPFWLNVLSSTLVIIYVPTLPNPQMQEAYSGIKMEDFPHEAFTEDQI